MRFVTFGDEDTQLFKNALKKYGGALTSQQVALTPGSITDFKLHGASAIVNAANMEVRFGGGLSGAIGKATGEANKIDEEARQGIQSFYDHLVIGSQIPQ